MLEDDFGTKWFFIGLVLSAIMFLVVLFSFPQVSAAAISFITPASEYNDMGLSGSTIATNPEQIAEISDNPTHQTRLYIKKGDDTEQLLVRTTIENSGSLQRSTVKKYSNSTVVYEAYWTSDPSELSLETTQNSQQYRVTKTNSDYTLDENPSQFNVDLNRVYSIIYREGFEWRPIKYTDRYSKEVIVYGLMRMPYNSKVIPITKHKSGRIYVDRDSGKIVEAHVSYTQDSEMISLDYYSNAVPRKAEPPEWIKPANFT